MGLTGVGKSTAIAALQGSGTAFTLLPNRRELTDRLIIPEMQRVAGNPLEPVRDRLERFDLTRRYRETHPGGMVHALKGYLEAYNDGTDTLMFDNLRGLDEAKAAVSTFPKARFVLLDAPPPVRLQRLVGRQDAFDKVAPAQRLSGDLRERLGDLEGLEAVFDPDALSLLAAGGVSEEEMLKGVRIILGEAKHYDMTTAADYLRKAKDEQGFLSLDTSALSVEDVQAKIQVWL